MVSAPREQDQGGAWYRLAPTPACAGAHCEPWVQLLSGSHRIFWASPRNTCNFKTTVSLGNYFLCLEQLLGVKHTFGS